MFYRAARQDHVRSVLPRVPTMAPAQLAACVAQQFTLPQTFGVIGNIRDQNVPRGQRFTDVELR
jgi:hypothetical protein